MQRITLQPYEGLIRLQAPPAGSVMFGSLVQKQNTGYGCSRLTITTGNWQLWSVLLHEITYKDYVLFYEKNAFLNK